jgi:hypothetical protein
VFYGFDGLAQYSGLLAVVLTKQFFREGSVMSDDRRAKAPTPVLRTRPATMLTAIGLCVFIMVMQLVPQFSEGGFSRITTATTTTTTTAVAR